MLGRNFRVDVVVRDRPEFKWPVVDLLPSTATVSAHGGFSRGELAFASRDIPLALFEFFPLLG